MNKKTLVIVGIVLFLIGIGSGYLFNEFILRPKVAVEYLNRGHGTGSDFIYEVFREIQGEVYANTITDEISDAIAFCGVVLYPIFHYIVSLRDGIRIKRKKTIAITIIGAVLAVGFISFFFMPTPILDSNWSGLLLVHLPYYFVFAIVMLFRSFKKAKVDNSRLEDAAAPETAAH